MNILTLLIVAFVPSILYVIYRRTQAKSKEVMYQMMIKEIRNEFDKSLISELRDIRNALSAGGDNKIKVQPIMNNFLHVSLHRVKAITMFDQRVIPISVGTIDIREDNRICVNTMREYINEFVLDPKQLYFSPTIGTTNIQERPINHNVFEIERRETIGDCKTSSKYSQLDLVYQ